MKQSEIRVCSRSCR